MDRELLENYIGLCRETERQIERLARMKSAEILPAQRESDGSQHAGSAGERMARAVEARLQYEAEAVPKIEANVRRIKMIRAAVDALLDPLEREVLRLRYLDGQYSRHTPWRQVSIQIYGDDDEKCLASTYRLHSRALAHFQQIER